MLLATGAVAGGTRSMTPGCAPPTHPLTPHPSHRPTGQLRYQPVSFAVTAAAPVLLAHGESVEFTAGTPLLLWSPEVPGFERRPGETMVITGAFPCEGSLRCAGRDAALGLAEWRAGQAHVGPAKTGQAVLWPEGCHQAWCTPVGSLHSCCSSHTVHHHCFPLPLVCSISGRRPESA